MSETVSVSYLWLIPALPLLGSALNALLTLSTSHREHGPSQALSGLIACLAPAGSFAITVMGFLQLRGLAVEERALTQHLFDWIPIGPLDLSMGFFFDPLSATMLLFVTGIGTLIHIYSLGYMSHDRGYSRYFAYLNLFMFAMILLVLGDNLVALFVGWEGVGLCSYLLIGFWYEDAEKAVCGMKAFVVNRIGDFGFLLGMFFIFWAFLQNGGEGTFNFLRMEEQATLIPTSVAIAAGILLFVGATGKSAQIPLYTWLPDAMAGPTPVSALIHAATMVTSGVYMVARMNWLYAIDPTALTVIAIIGTLTALFAATIGITQFDIKKVLAYSTVSQLGYMFLGVGVGAYAAGLFHVFTHAFFKALMFLGAGSVIHALHHEQDIRKMGGLFKKVPITAWTFLAGWLAICGIFPFAGFFSKDEILWKAFSTENALLPWLPKALWVVAFLAAGITALYMTRLVAMTFFGKSRVEPEKEAKIHESPPSMTIPLAILAAGSLLVGFLGTPQFLGLGANRFEGWLEPVFERGAMAAHGELGHGMGELHAATGADASHGDDHETESASTDDHGDAAAHAGAAPHGDAHGDGHEHNVALEWGLMFASVAIAALGILIALLLYVRRPETPERIAASMGGLYRLVRDKYRVDELYDAIIVRPLVGVSRSVLHAVVDQKIIDLIVNGVGVTTKITSFLFRLFQTGYVQAYAFVILLGLAVLLFGVL